MGAAVSVRDLRKHFGAFHAVDGVSFDVAAGEIFGFLGANGAGKSTTIRMLCGLLRPTSGDASVLGHDVARDPEGVKKRIGYMSQRFSLYDDLSVRNNLRFFGGVYGLRGSELREREQWAVRMSGLEGMERRLTGELPGGWKQRLALASAVMHRPRVLFLDEPTSGVDPLSRRRFWQLIEEMAHEGVTVFVTTHYLDEAEHCDRIALMSKGRIVALGSVEALRSVFAGRAVLEVTCPRVVDALETLSRLAEVREISVFGTKLHAIVDDAAPARRRIEAALAADGNVPADLASIVPSLEDVFIHYAEADA